jgi:hypothetical protein
MIFVMEEQEIFNVHSTMTMNYNSTFYSFVPVQGERCRR